MDPYALPLEQLAVYLEQAVPGLRGPLTAVKFKGGQSNPTYLIEAASGRYVLRRKPSGDLLASAHAVDREFRVLCALRDSAVPVAGALHLCTDEGVIGSWFYLMEYVDGSVFWDPALPEISREQRAFYYQAIAQSLGALHKVEVNKVGLADYGKPSGYFARQLKRWSSQYYLSETGKIPLVDRLISELELLLPADDGRVALVHGDFRVDNLMFDRLKPQVLAIVDWELSTLGHPLSDAAYFCMALRLPNNPTLPGLGGHDREALGIPTEAAWLEQYFAASGQAPVAYWPFCLAFNFFRLAAIAQGVFKRSLQGNASNERAAEAGKIVPMLANMGLQALQNG